ncbi:Sensor histidine kinase ComP [Paenibacillus sp. CECT 9249]|uniref:ATP-binding protein n=1 Tax=Paenibacillus sp. CECT 9249 TaxID=2845385 RepID=UPI001E35596D|nr:ATP-binding protein [Paenibacillus sp. CECT 9249]CAH0118896.1 Sensor histidine kinase ComP [Paenibacillus sp. CECT 9249]
MKILKHSRMILILVAAFVLASYLFYTQIQIRYLGVIVEKESTGEWVVTKVDSKGGAQIKGIKPGDRVISIDRKPPENHYALKWNALGNIGQIVLERDGEQFVINVPTGLQLPDPLKYLIAPAFMFLLLFSLSVFLLIKKPGDPVASLLIFFFLDIALGYLSSFSSSRRDIVGMMVVGGGVIYCPVLFLHFLHRFFKQKRLKIVNLNVIIGLYIIGSILFFIDIFFLLTEIGFYIPFAFITNSMLLFFAIGIVISLYILIVGYFRYSKTNYKPLLKYLFFGNIVSFTPFICFYVLPLVFFGKVLIEPSNAGLFLLLLPLFYVYLIAANHLMDIDFVIHRLRYFCLLAIVPSILIAGGNEYFIHPQESEPIRWFQSLLLVYFSIILLLYMKDWLDFRFRNRLFKGKYNFQASLDRFSNQITKIMKVSDLEEWLLREVLDVLPTKAVALLEMNHTDHAVTVKRTIGSFPKREIIHELELDNREYKIGDFIPVTTGMCCIVGNNQNSQTLIWVRGKENRVKFNHEELIWLQTMSNYVSIVYENLQLVEGVIMDLEVRSNGKAPSWILRLLFRLTENERRRLAADLHDSALQDQLLWYRKLEMVLDEYELSDEARANLNQIKEGLLDVVHQIRETCNELRPPFLKEMGVIEAIENLCQYAQLNSNYSVDFNHDGFDLVLDDEYVLTIYRITQELLRNTMKHGQATNVEIILRKNEQHIVYVYKDNGIGMDLQHLQSSFKHMGLSGIRERVSGLEGETKFSSAKGEGFEVIITLPYIIESSSSYYVMAGGGIHD